MASTIRKKLLRWLLELQRREYIVRGRPVLVVTSPYYPDITPERVIDRLESAFDLIERYQPIKYRRLMKDFAGFVIRRYPTRGAYFPDGRCLVELTFIGNERFSDEEIASTIVHEAVHARLHQTGCQYHEGVRARHERLCRRAELALARAVPNGDIIAARAAAVLDASDDDVAPDIDWKEAWHQVAIADFRGMSAPAWLKKIMARRRGIDPSVME